MRSTKSAAQGQAQQSKREDKQGSGFEPLPAKSNKETGRKKRGKTRLVLFIVRVPPSVEFCWVANGWVTVVRPPFVVACGNQLPADEAMSPACVTAKKVMSVYRLVATGTLASNVIKVECLLAAVHRLWAVVMGVLPGKQDQIGTKDVTQPRKRFRARHSTNEERKISQNPAFPIASNFGGRGYWWALKVKRCDAHRLNTKTSMLPSAISLIVSCTALGFTLLVATVICVYRCFFATDRDI